MFRKIDLDKVGEIFKKGFNKTDISGLITNKVVLTNSYFYDIDGRKVELDSRLITYLKINDSSELNYTDIYELGKKMGRENNNYVVRKLLDSVKQVITIENNLEFVSNYLSNFYTTFRKGMFVIVGDDLKDLKSDNFEVIVNQEIIDGINNYNKNIVKIGDCYGETFMITSDKNSTCYLELLGWNIEIERKGFRKEDVVWLSKLIGLGILDNNYNYEFKIR